MIYWRKAASRIRHMNSELSVLFSEHLLSQRINETASLWVILLKVYIKCPDKVLSDGLSYRKA